MTAREAALVCLLPHFVTSQSVGNRPWPVRAAETSIVFLSSCYPAPLQPALPRLWSTVGQIFTSEEIPQIEFIVGLQRGWAPCKHLREKGPSRSERPQHLPLHSPETRGTDLPYPVGFTEQLHPLPRNRQQDNSQVTSGLRTSPGLAQGLWSKTQGNKTPRPPHG